MSTPYDYEAAVRQFHEAMGVPCASVPTVADEATRVLRVRLLLEEVLEFAKAAGVLVAFDGEIIPTVEHLGFSGELFKPDLTEMAHELADIQYVTSGANLTFGFPSAEAFNEIHLANMRKLGADGKPVRRADGKIVKPSGWRPADVASVLAKHATTPGREHED